MTLDLPRGTLRAAAIVFLAILVGGVGLTGASALWSQRSQVTATVTLGDWREDDADIRFAVAQTNNAHDNYQLELSFLPPEGQGPVDSYRVRATGVVNGVSKADTTDVRAGEGRMTAPLHIQRTDPAKPTVTAVTIQARAGGRDVGDPVTVTITSLGRQQHRIS